LQRSDISTCKDDLWCLLHCPTQHVRHATIHKVPSSLYFIVTIFLFYPFAYSFPYSINVLATPVFWSTLTRPLVDLMFSPIPSKHPNKQTTEKVHSQFTQISFMFLCIPLMLLYLISHPTACSQLHTSVMFLALRSCCFLLTALLL
jgi:hypothetical protein